VSTPVAGHVLPKVGQSVTATCEEAWESPPPHLVMPDGTVHVWRASLDSPLRHVERLTRVLSDAEHTRAGQFCFERDRNRFIARRGLLRMILGRYLAIPPDRLQVHSGVNGKPALSASQAGGIDFSVSHSHGLALYAVTRGRRIGIDIERIRAVPDSYRMAGRVLSPREYAVFRILPREQQQTALFYAWTRKEAYSKACGRGLSCPFDHLDVSLAPFEPSRPLSLQGQPHVSSGWSLQGLTAAPGYAAALAYEAGGELPVSCWQWPEWL
jgi:4'-phosphopantetheinyl transferase